MSLGNFIIGASATAALVFNLPLGIATGPVAPDIATDVSGGCLMVALMGRWRGPSYEESLRNGLPPEEYSPCFYLDENIAGHFRQLDIFVRETRVQTEEIGCPETETHPAFRAAYSEGHLLVNYRIKNSSTEGPWHVFDEPPPDETGLDPLRDLDQSSFVLIKDRLFAAVKRLGLPHNLEMTNIYEDGMGSPLEHAPKARKTIVNYLLKVCDSVISAIQEQYGSYRQLCARNYHDAQGAIDAARDAGWSFEPDHHDILVKPPVKT